MGAKKILVIVGTRPEAIKLAPVLSALKRDKSFEVVVVSTGQHRELLEPIFRLFEIRPDVDLAMMRHDQTLEDIAAHLFQLIPPVLLTHKPDLVLVQGDTSTAFLGGLCAFYQKIPVAHVEAGLRTADKLNPFPEEMNRRLLSSLADIHFAPTEGNRDNLLREGIDPKKIHVTGNTVIDALLQIAARPFSFDNTELAGIESKRIILVTTHRRENFGKPLEQICLALRAIAGSFPDVEIVLPVHPNPSVTSVVKRELQNATNIRLTAPLDYATFVHLMKASTLILTDSGGLQEEAPSLGKPVLVMRSTTERPEAVDAGTVRLTGTSAERIIEEASELLSNPAKYDAMARAVNPYGDGKAAERIKQALLSIL